ncbi:MAG: hypothetical protein M3P49_09830 [Actinomycetota bacterium]|nr:hypothetical protein [Actinomycetota bacterium]
MKATTNKEANLVRSLEITGIDCNGMTALNLDMVVTGPLSEATDVLVASHGRVTEQISSEFSWRAGRPNSKRIDTVKGGSWFASLIRDCLRSTDLELPDDRLPISMTEEIKDAMKGRVIKASLSTDPRSGRVRIEKRSIELVPLAQLVLQPERDVTPVLLGIL